MSSPRTGRRNRWRRNRGTVTPPGAATSVALVAAVDGLPSGVDTGIRLATTDAAGDRATLAGSGADVDALLWEGVPPMFSFRDPDANTIYVTQTPG